MIKPQVIWFIGLSGAGKITLATNLEEALNARNLARLTNQVIRLAHQA